MQNGSIAIANALEILQSCAKKSIYLKFTLSLKNMFTIQRNSVGF